MLSVPVAARSSRIEPAWRPIVRVILRFVAASVDLPALYATQQKEQFSLAFIQAVAAAAGCNVARAAVDDESVDLELIAAHDAADLRPSPHLAIQAKCTALDSGDGGTFLARSASSRSPLRH